MNIEDERRGKWAVLLSNCASRHVTLYRFHQVFWSKMELLIGELYNQGRCDRHARLLYGSVPGNSGDISPLVFVNLWFFVPNFIFLRKWRQWRSVTRTLISTHLLYRMILLHQINREPGVVGSGNGVVYLASPGRPTEIGLQLGKACYPCSR